MITNSVLAAVSGALQQAPACDDVAAPILADHTEGRVAAPSRGAVGLYIQYPAGFQPPAASARVRPIYEAILGHIYI